MNMLTGDAIGALRDTALDNNGTAALSV